MDTDIARGVLLLTLENFAFFCAEFGISSLGPGMSVTDLDGVQFVALQFVELGGDHLDRLVRFTAADHDICAVRASETETRLPRSSPCSLNTVTVTEEGWEGEEDFEMKTMNWGCLWGVSSVCLPSRVAVVS